MLSNLGLGPCPGEVCFRLVMVKSGQDGIRQVRYRPPVPDVGGIEVLSLAELHRRMAARPGMDTAQRIDFHQLLTVQDGLLQHMVDFTDHTVGPGAWLWVRPGQIQQFRDPAGVTGTLVLFQPGAVDAPTATQTRLEDPFGRTDWHLSEEDLVATGEAREHLVHAFGNTVQLPAPVRSRILEHLLAVVLLQLAHPATPLGSPAAEHTETFLRFRTAVEERFADTRLVGDYARALGYSPRTLTRATTAAAGMSAKEFIDGRVVLEAKRLLAHGDDPVARVADRLGFDDASNFVKYFALRTGTTPAAFRHRYRGGGESSCQDLQTF